MFKKKQSTQVRSMVLDTCALIDGRIIAIAKTGFLPERLYIPQFVIAELQYLADNGDSQKRERARFGLDVIRDLQDMRRSEVVIAREQYKNIKEVDDKLIALAKQYGSMLYTTDYNLNKVAQIEGVVVLNVNELAQAVRPPRLPGEQVEIKITQIGQDKTQGVGYLEDGTMVVVEQASRLVGQRVRVEFSRILQTQAGKMMFAVLLNNRPQPNAVGGVQQQPRAQQVYHHSGGGQRPQHSQQQQPRPAAPQQTRQPQATQAQPPQQQPQRQRPQQRPQQRRTTPEDSLIAAVRNQDQQ